MRITPWVIASITLTLALFSGNYAWHTQQQVEKLNLRIDQLEVKTSPHPTTGLLETPDKLAKTAQQLLTLTQTQGQQATTISTLKNEFTTETEQTSSRLTTLEDGLAGLLSQTQEPAHKKTVKKPLIAPASDNESHSQAAAETTHDKTDGNAKNTELADSDLTKNWIINIASFSDTKAANETYAKVLNIVDKASIKAIIIKGKTVYRVRAESYSSLAKAEREALALQTQLGLSGLWISPD